MPQRCTSKCRSKKNSIFHRHFISAVLTLSRTVQRAKKDFFTFFFATIFMLLLMHINSIVAFNCLALDFAFLFLSCFHCDHSVSIALSISKYMKKCTQLSICTIQYLCIFYCIIHNLFFYLLRTAVCARIKIAFENVVHLVSYISYQTEWWW